MIASPASSPSGGGRSCLRNPRALCVLLLLYGSVVIGWLGNGHGAAHAANTPPNTAHPVEAEAAVAATNDSANQTAWDTLAKVRDRLRTQSPLAAGFSQTFVPSGFSTGDQESGTLYVDLPKCLRFEYSEPFPKDFLLCGDWVYTWNPGDPSGRRFLIDDSEAEGIDLLRLEVETLKTRYRAEIQSGDAGRTVIELFPTNEDSDIREASVEVGRTEGSEAPSATFDLLALSYMDHSGNRTRFEISHQGELATKADFETPDLEWLED